MDLFHFTDLAIPAMQMALLLLLNTLSLLFGRIRLALIITYLFTLYWGYVLNGQSLVSAGLENVTYYTAIYFGFGITIAVFALTGFLVHQDR
ncbi:MAG: hypothetical protein SV775_01620 [Thermodesulfobacteriota bacterium]|nr:hypothetical protein [Thermodesulfobacteriota bacterium]